MEKRPSQKNLVLAVVATIIVLVLGIGGISLRNSYLQSLSESEAKALAINNQVFNLDFKLIDSTGNETNYSMNANVGETLFSVVQRYDINNDDFKMEYTEYEGIGAFITNFNNISIDANSQFWELFVNGESSQVGASDYLVQKGDVISYKVTNFN